MTDSFDKTPKKAVPEWWSGAGQHRSPLVAAAMRELAEANPDADFIDGEALNPVMLAMYTTFVIESARISSATGELPGSRY